MKLLKLMALVLPAYILLGACAKRPKMPSKQPINALAANVSSSESNSPAPVDVAALEKKQAELEAQKAELEAQQKNIETQQVLFAEPGAMQGPAFAEFMANAQALPAVGVDQAIVDDIVQAVMDLDVAALVAAVQDLIADLVAAAADVQAQIDAVKAQIAAAKA